MSYTFLQEQGDESSAECFSGILQSAPSSWENTLAVSSDLVQKEETLNQVEEIARSCGMSPTWEMVDHYASRVAFLEGESEKDLACLRSQQIRNADLEALIFECSQHIGNRYPDDQAMQKCINSVLNQK